MFGIRYFCFILNFLHFSQHSFVFEFLYSLKRMSIWSTYTYTQRITIENAKELFKLHNDREQYSRLAFRWDAEIRLSRKRFPVGVPLKSWLWNGVVDGLLDLFLAHSVPDAAANGALMTLWSLFNWNYFLYIYLERGPLHAKIIFMNKFICFNQ